MCKNTEQPFMEFSMQKSTISLIRSFNYLIMIMMDTKNSIKFVPHKI